jgi:hypothetical protein
MLKRLRLAAIVLGALLLPSLAVAATKGPPVPESVTFPVTKVVQGESTTGTVCLSAVPTEPTEVLLRTDNTFAGTVEPESIVIAPPDQCGTFTVHTSTTGFTRELHLIVSAFANGGVADAVLPIIPFEGYDLVEILKADVNRSFGRVSIVATSDEPGAVLTAFAGGVELGQLEQKGDRYVGRFDLDGTPINNVEVHSSLGGCAQHAVPFGSGSTHC